MLSIKPTMASFVTFYWPRAVAVKKSSDVPAAIFIVIELMIFSCLEGIFFQTSFLQHSLNVQRLSRIKQKTLEKSNFMGSMLATVINS